MFWREMCGKQLKLSFFCEMSVFYYSIHIPYPYNCMDKDTELNLQNLSIVDKILPGWDQESEIPVSKQDKFWIND